MICVVNGIIYVEVNIFDVIDFDVVIYDLNGFFGILFLVNDDVEIFQLEDGNIKIVDVCLIIFWLVVDLSIVVVFNKLILFLVVFVVIEIKVEDF